MRVEAAYRCYGFQSGTPKVASASSARVLRGANRSQSPDGGDRPRIYPPPLGMIWCRDPTVVAKTLLRGPLLGAAMSAFQFGAL